MKKTLYILLISFAASMAFTSCAEEDIKPVEKVSNGGGGGSFDPL